MASINTRLLELGFGRPSDRSVNYDGQTELCDGKPRRPPTRPDIIDIQ